MAREIKLAGFKYTKLSAERVEDFKGDLKITPNINISNIDKPKSSIKQDSLVVDFIFGVDYNGLGKIELFGKMYLIVDSKTVKEVIDGWNLKKLDNEINMVILNIIMQKASLKALELEEELNLPPHIQLPRLQLEKQEKN
jgi:hypothetical protein